MNKIVMVVWGLTIFSLCALIFFIGYKEQDKDYLSLQSNLREATKMYMKDNNMHPKISESVKIYIDDLINGNYISNNDKIKNYCVDSVVFSNGLLKDTFKLNTKCEE